MKKLCVTAGAIILLIAAGFTFYNSRIADDADDPAEFIEALTDADAPVEPQRSPFDGFPADDAVGASDDEYSKSMPVLTLDPDYVRALAVYDDFLRGGYGKRDENGTYTPAIAEGLKMDWDRIGDVPWEDYLWTYAVYDMNHDGIPELHVRPGPGHYTIYTYDKKPEYIYSPHGPTVWTGWSYSSSFVLPLNNGATLGHRPGTYSGVAMNFYTYSVYDFFGQEQYSLFYDTLYTASKHDAGALWYDNLLTKKEFLRAMDLLIQKVMDPELLNVRATAGAIEIYCDDAS
ncbi:MAG: hypothetical protein LBK57_07470 [Clostridiales Family XIII bacterium]|jgi:hypothetical protein|nr:hypothetical protein [Clostridiales Family XIII bacterium]